MMPKKQTTRTWLVLLLLLTAVTLLAACSGGDQMLLAEFNSDGEAEIFLAGLDEAESEWQTLAEDVQRTFLFEGELAAFVPETNRILLWYIDGNDLRVEQMEIRDEAPAEVFEADAEARLFTEMEPGSATIYFTETEGFDNFRCYVSQDGAEAERLARGESCFVNASGAVQTEFDPDDGVTVTLISLDGEEETVILDEVEDVFNVRYNEELTRFAYVEFDGDEAQMYLVEPGAEEAEQFGEEFAFIDNFGFSADGETIYVIGMLDEDDDEVGLFINAVGDALIEADDITLAGQSEDGDYAVFLTESDDEMAAFVYSLAEGTVTEIAEEPSVSLVGFLTEDRFLLQTENDDEDVLLSVSNDGNEEIELLETDDYDILFAYMNNAAEQLLVQLTDDEGTDTLYVTSLAAEDGYFLLEEWSAITILAATDEYLIFAGREDEDDDRALYSIAWAEDSSETELDDDAEFGFRGVFFAADGRSIYYTAMEDGLDDTEVRRVPVDGSESPEDLYRDMVLLDVSWVGEPNLQFLR
ncbi:MAG: hypothetical protein CL608_15570 [Anaerolineaceae bacterium]|nr:hypothetical protein [Anaerolineaceae bacterium]